MVKELMVEELKVEVLMVEELMVEELTIDEQSLEALDRHAADYCNSDGESCDVASIAAMLCSPLLQALPQTSDKGITTDNLT